MRSSIATNRLTNRLTNQGLPDSATESSSRTPAPLVVIARDDEVKVVLNHALAHLRLRG